MPKLNHALRVPETIVHNNSVLVAMESSWPVRCACQTRVDFGFSSVWVLTLLLVLVNHGVHAGKRKQPLEVTDDQIAEYMSAKLRNGDQRQLEWHQVGRELNIPDRVARAVRHAICERRLL